MMKVAGATLAGLMVVTSGAFAAKASLESVLAGDWRNADAKSRDAERHPAEALKFWGLKPGMKILEVQPGGGWWTDILAPYAAATGGEFYATAADLDNPDLSANAKKGREDFAAKFSDARYGKVNLLNWGSKSKPLPADQFDFVMLTRGFHGWMNQNLVEKNLKDVYGAVKPGGVFAIEQHRAKAGQDPAVFNGYVDEAYLIAQVEKVGFKLAGKSEINANPKDTKDHPFGVWTLPPTRQSSANGKPVDPAFDRAKYDAIGESDRMTLKFVKPKK
jgi:predicted methyltransferase